MPLRQFLSTFAIPIGSGLGFLLMWARQRGPRTGTPIDTNDPLWSTAVARARATVGELPDLFAQYGSEIYLKYALPTRNDGVEHVWGRLLEISDQNVKVSLETEPVGRRTSDPPHLLSMSEVEDWQVLLPDGRIRGGFTTQAQIALARKHGRSVPPNIADMEHKFVDSLSPPAT